MRRLKQLLHHFFYKDRATVLRPAPMQNGYLTNFNCDYQPVYEDIPCHLAQYGKQLSAHRDDRTQIITEDLRLCCDPEYEILEDDIVEVVHQGQSFTFIAGTAFNYFDHKEISVRRRKEAGEE